MRHQKKHPGFTIIEVMLFLAITGLMLAGVMVAINGTVNRQRYVDAVDSFHNYLQSQYALVASVRNNRPASVACTTAGISTGSTTDTRGTSDCTIIGRYLHTTGAGGRNIASLPVYARTDVMNPIIQSPAPAATVAQRINDLRLVIAPDDGTLEQDRDDYTPAWQTSLYTDSANRSTSGEFAMLIIRMPTDGLTRTFTKVGAAGRTSADIATVVNNTITSPLSICVDPAGLTSSPANGVRVLPNAINANSIQYATGADCS